MSSSAASSVPSGTAAEAVAEATALAGVPVVERETTSHEPSAESTTATTTARLIRRVRRVRRSCLREEVRDSGGAVMRTMLRRPS
ncbi:hypothetical protein ACFV6F_40630 [Kitasatospora phosalacinea]|uniref:hypothetical protein n=1 Tax=Kitasatospora phosalacinea TaxID=2065 RepID=UPI003660BA34